MSATAAQKDRSSEGVFALEAQYYDGGLHVQSLATPSRVTWAPPSDHVGFRNEIPSGDDDAVVEFARFLVDQRRVTWIGVFRKSVDRVFGDRKNNDGVGVWLLDSHVLDAHGLLDALDQLASAVAKGKINEIGRDAERLSREFLPQFLRSDAGIPDRLCGWPASTTALPETEFFVASADTAEQRLKLAAEQILRLQFLPPPDPSYSRALILVPSNSGASKRGERSDLKPLKTGFGKELAEYLPSALAETAGEKQQLAHEAQSLAIRLEQASTALTTSKAETEHLKGEVHNLQQVVQRLEKELQENDVLRRLSSIDTMLRTLDERSNRVDTNVRDIRNQVSSGFMSMPRERPVRVETSNPIRRDTAATQVRQETDLTWLYYGLLGVAILGLVVLLVWLITRWVVPFFASLLPGG